MAVLAFLVGLAGLVTALLTRGQAKKAIARAEAAAATAERAAREVVSAAVEARALPERTAKANAKALPAPVVMTKRRPAPIGRDTLLAVVHHQLATLEHRRRAELPAPADAVPGAAGPFRGEDGLPRLAPAAGPRDVPTTVPQRHDGEPFHWSGTFTERGIEEFPIDWPQPGKAAMALVTAKAAQQYLTVTPMTRTRSRVATHAVLLNAFSSDGLVRRRALLTPEMTHLKVEGRGGLGEWSVQLVGPADLERLLDQREGTGSTVLALPQGTPLELVVHANSSSWHWEFVCGCWAGEDCVCPPPEGLDWFSRMLSGNGEGMGTLVIPRPGLLVGELDGEQDPWRLRLRPLGSED
ncbi:hypothetical protein ACFYNO_16710 [Kitasatospora sp. NPDC006697]|uniref:hypothetical protein n=1 Tax=Kitasatospora sp. NPDC006697 TaxID=3364020 RepID=UPI0036BE614C